MKKVVNTLIILLTINTSVMAQKGFTVEKEIAIDVPAEKLWEMVGPGFVDVYKWSSSVDHAVGAGKSEFEGASCDERSCDLNVKGFSSIKEKVVAYSDPKMNLAYEVFDGMPGFVSKAVNNWTVVSIGENQSKLVMKATFETKGLMGSMMNGMMRKKMNVALETVLNDAKTYAETGSPSMVKQDRIAKLAKKSKKAA